ncbi:MULTISPECIES: FAD-dependent thymidylate synthase [unclassified Streptomyces]|uniref:FAD-dependent thymidylate synthase n=1 Tax=unclassified Streptomyces TaxID=2593676 RepID=UPI0003AAB083|nr:MULTISPECIES: FAD-dependent thymidylate synthase [unclassified Streptomyces]
MIKHAAEDADVTFAARVSTQGGESRFNEATEKDAGLINYLMRDRHGSPFEHTSFTFYVETPIFVAREFFRHRTGWSYNEESGRYKELAPVFYVPADGRPLRQVGKPGAYSFIQGDCKQKVAVQGDLRRISTEAYETYTRLLDLDVAREVARMVLPVNIYTSFYATCNARSLMHFLGLRTSRTNARFPSFPQHEIEMVAEGLETEFARYMPLTYAAFEANGRVAP